MMTIHIQTTRAAMNANRQFFGNDCTAGRAHLGCLPGGNFDHFLSSFCRFETKYIEESKPGYVPHGSIEAPPTVLAFELFYVNGVIFSNQLIGSLKMKVFSLIKNFFMCLCNQYPGFIPAIRSLLFSGKYLLPFGKQILGLLKKSKIIYFVALGVCQERCTAHIDAYPFTGLRKRPGQNIVTGKRDKPFIRRPSANSNRFNVSFNGAGEEQLEFPDVRDVKIFAFKPPTALPESKGIISVTALKTRKAWFTTIFDAAKESSISPVQAYKNVLETLGANGFKFRKFLLKPGQLVHLVIKRHGNLSLFPDADSLFEGKVIKGSAYIQPLIAISLCVFIYFSFVEKGFSHLLFWAFMLTPFVTNIMGNNIFVNKKL